MDALTKKKAQRFEYLKALYDATDGDSSAFVDMDAVADGIGFDRLTAVAVMQYLDQEGLAEFRYMGGGIGITHRGVVEVERALSKPEQATQYFPPFNVIHVENMIGSQIQQGSHHVTQSQDVSLDLGAVRTLIDEFQRRLPELPLTVDARIRYVTPEEFVEFLEEIARPTKRRRPKASEATQAPGPAGLISAAQAAAFLGLKPQTLAKMRLQGKSPPYHKIGSRVLYHVADLDAWIAERKQRSTSNTRR